MSRNLCQSTCCDNTVRLSDLRGKPIEFRRYHTEPPQIGTRWDCPTCGTAYFAIWRDAEWCFNGSRMAPARGFVIDLSYYESFNDEPGKLSEIKNPRHLCLDNAEDIQEIWQRSSSLIASNIFQQTKTSDGSTASEVFVYC